MIAHLSGRLIQKTTQSVVVEVGGVGYEVLVPLSTLCALPPEQGQVSLRIHTHVREDALQLFGFLTPLEKELFLMLISVAGIGPRLALNILSGTGPDDLAQAIGGGDVLRLQRIPGVGRKTAERIALELRDQALRLLGMQEAPPPLTEVSARERRLLEDAHSALVNLGYPPKRAQEAIRKARASLPDAPLEGLIRQALKLLA